ncbi:hypothetical protein V5799_005281 [Amblyomma americanum]|uniref:Uncharacterized protein n=1 Tax=Amblyomma americanum TaxID=6943 RepID=A0AAQ4DZP6_AMBAM
MRTPVRTPSPTANDRSGSYRVLPEADEMELQREEPRIGDEPGHSPQPSTPDGVFPLVQRDAVNMPRACLILAVLVVIAATCYIVVSRLIFIAQWLSANGFPTYQSPRSPAAPGAKWGAPRT